MSLESYYARLSKRVRRLDCIMVRVVIGKDSLGEVELDFALHGVSSRVATVKFIIRPLMPDDTCRKCLKAYDLLASFRELNR